jgi:hypothetical protein
MERSKRNISRDGHREGGDDDRDRGDRADAIDAIIRRRFRHCPTLPLFADAPRRGFFEASDIGLQLRLLDLPSNRSR